MSISFSLKFVSESSCFLSSVFPTNIFLLSIVNNHTAEKRGFYLNPLVFPFTSVKRLQTKHEVAQHFSEFCNVVRRIHRNELPSYNRLNLFIINPLRMERSYVDITYPYKCFGQKNYLRMVEMNFCAGVYVWNSCKLVPTDSETGSQSQNTKFTKTPFDLIWQWVRPPFLVIQIQPSRKARFQRVALGAFEMMTMWAR